MPTPASGTINFSNIESEFGSGGARRNLGKYRVSQNVGTLTNLPLDAGIPQSVSIGSSTIRFSDFYNKRLNVVVNLTGLADNSTRLNARTIYGNGTNNVVIGGFRGYPLDPSSSYRIFINLNTRIGSAKGARTNVAFRTGNWRTSGGSADTILTLEMGPNTRLYGAGGDGGSSNTSYLSTPTRPAPNAAAAGVNGTSALGIDYPTIVRNFGRIQCGGGGGGAGGSETYPQGKGSRRSTGGGGGGGAGFPFANGGVASADFTGTQGSAGAAGSYETSGAGGAGGTNAGPGGAGGGPPAFGSGAPGANTPDQLGGAGGVAGYSIVIATGGSGWTIPVVGTELGARLSGTNPT